MVRSVGAASVLAAMVLAVGCTSSHAELATYPVPIGSVTEVASFTDGGKLSVAVDDFRGCPTAFAVSADESDAEIRLTAFAYRGQHRECDELPTVSLERPVGSRRIVDTTSGFFATSGSGEELKEPCAGQDRCLFAYSEVPTGRTFQIAPLVGGEQLEVYVRDPHA